MELIKQNEEGLYPTIQKVGCFFISCLDIAQLKAEKKLEKNQINEIWDWANQHGYIVNDCIRESAPIINRGLCMLNCPGRFIEVGIKTKKGLNYYKWAEKEGLLAESYIRKIKQNGPSGTHFILVDENENVIEDPHNPPIHEVEWIYTIAYAYKL